MIGKRTPEWYKLTFHFSDNEVISTKCKYLEEVFSNHDAEWEKIMLAASDMFNVVIDEVNDRKGPKGATLLAMLMPRPDDSNSFKQGAFVADFGKNYRGEWTLNMPHVTVTLSFDGEDDKYIHRDLEKELVKRIYTIDRETQYACDVEEL